MSFARVLAIMMPFLLAAQFPVPAEPTLPISVTIVLETYEADVVLAASEEWISFNGTLVLEDPLQREIDVSLTASCPAGWGASCDPPIHKFYTAGEKAFTCNVRVAGVKGNMTGTIVIQGMAHWRGEALASNLSPPLVINVTKLPVQPSSNQSGLQGPDFQKRLGSILPQLTVIAVLVAAVAVVAVAWRWRRRRRSERPAGEKRAGD